jgi:hypothetical protein
MNTITRRAAADNALRDMSARLHKFAGFGETNYAYISGFQHSMLVEICARYPEALDYVNEILSRYPAVEEAA